MSSSNKSNFLCLLLLFCLDITVSAQLPGMRKYTQLDGFSATNSYELEQDERGYLWIGTDNGGMCFDGKKFRGLLEKGRFPDAEILAIRPLSHDRVLLIPITHNVCYIDKGRLITEKEDPRLKGTYSANSNITRYDPVNKTFWLSNSHELGRLVRFSGKEITHYAATNKWFSIESVIGDWFIGQISDSLDPLAFTTCAYNQKTKKYQYLYTASGKRLSPKESIVASGADTTYVLTYNDKLKKVFAYHYTMGDSLLKQVTGLDLLSREKSQPLLTLDRNRNLWAKFVGKEGLWYYGNILERRGNEDAFHLPEPGMINSILVDRNSNLWISSQNNALYFISGKHFRNALMTRRFPMKKEIPKSISGDGKGRLCISYVNNTDLVVTGGATSRIISLGDNFREGSRNIIPLKNNRFLLYNGEVAIYDMDKQTLTYIDQSAVTGKDVCIYKEKDLLIAESSRVKHIMSFEDKRTKAETIFNGRSTAVDVLQNGTILIGTSSGLFAKKELLGAALKVKGFDTIGDCNITDILPLSNGAALIGTNAQGMFLYDQRGEIHPIEKGRINHIRSLYRQNDSVYWACTNEGVYAFTFDRSWQVKKEKNYTFYDGLPSNNATSIYVCRDTAYVATSEGLGIIPLNDSTLLQMDPPEVYLNTLQTDKTTFWYPDSLLTLPSGQNNLLLSFSAISYESLGNIRYYYRLFPLQNSWIKTTDPEVRFAGLPPGKYTFQLYALNAKGIRSVQTASLDIHIQPTFWQTFYFKILLLALAALLFYFLLRWWLLRQEKKKYVKMQDKKRLAELELEAIKAQINPHFIYNCLNSIQYLNYKAKHEEAQQYLDLFSRLIRMTMQYSQQAFIPLEEEINYLSLYLQLEKLRFKDRLQYTIDADPAISPERLLPAMLIQPYVENALKHGIAGREKGEIRIQFGTQGDRLLVTVGDDGGGFGDLRRPGAMGLKLSGTRALSYNELFNLNIDIHSYNRQDRKPNTTGAVVNISIPLIPYGTTN